EVEGPPREQGREPRDHVVPGPVQEDGDDDGPEEQGDAREPEDEGDGVCERVGCHAWSRPPVNGSAPLILRYLPTPCDDARQQLSSGGIRWPTSMVSRRRRSTARASRWPTIATRSCSSSTWPRSAASRHSTTRFRRSTRSMRTRGLPCWASRATSSQARSRAA